MEGAHSLQVPQTSGKYFASVSPLSKFFPPVSQSQKHGPKEKKFQGRRTCTKHGTALSLIEQAVWEAPPQYAPAPCKLTFDLLTLKVVSKSRVTWPIPLCQF